jgi:hypothetical protein
MLPRQRKSDVKKEVISLTEFQAREWGDLEKLLFI